MKAGKLYFQMIILILFSILFQIFILEYFNLAFQLRKNQFYPTSNNGIKISCANKKKLYETFKYSNDPGFKLYYKKYCKILTSTIEASKRKQYDDLISKSINKTKTTWNIVKNVTNKRNSQNKIASMNINTLRTGAFKLFKCTFPGSKQFKSTFILCFFKNL